MAIRYIEPTISENATSVSVTFLNDEDKQYVRSINVPYSNNVVNLTEWNQRLEDHLRAVIHKHSVGVIQFVDPPTANTANT